MSNIEPGEEGLCINCGVFCQLYQEKYCESCFEKEIEILNNLESENEGTCEKEIEQDNNYNKNNYLKIDSTLNSLIPFEYTGNPQTCIICMDFLSPGQTAISLPCAHTFHGNCIFSWLSKNVQCPICRNEVITQNFFYK